MFSLLYSSPLLPLASGTGTTTSRKKDLHTMEANLSLSTEFNLLQNLLSSSSNLHKVRLTFSSSPATSNSLLNSLTSSETTILHYSGHGTADFLTGESKFGLTEPISIPVLTSLISSSSTGHQNLKLVFISACQSESMASCFDFVPHVVAISVDKNVLDERAIQFSATFYSDLLSGKTVSAAFSNACVSVSIADKSDQRTFDEDACSQFLLLGSGDHDVQLFTPSPESANSSSFFEDVSPKPSLTSYEPKTPNAKLVGNRETMQELFQVRERKRGSLDEDSCDESAKLLQTATSTTELTFSQ